MADERPQNAVTAQSRPRVFQVQQSPQTKKPVVQVQPAANAGGASGRIAVTQVPATGQSAQLRVVGAPSQAPR